MSDLTVYEKPTCTTCRKLATLLREHGIDYDKVNYQVLGLEADELRDLLAKAGLSAREVLRTREPEYKELGLADTSLTEDQLIATIVEHPALLQRPIVVRGDRAVLARPVEKVLELLD
ncbi:arsenate reductase family protein [Nocardioides sp.]|uniref:arsenate reductase family protein n=1 Tax=Nocardioides sp. TaxID=35761 RepID=UPI0026033589|nr:arsenate reductase family protein [Nocardioides sp.]